MKRRSLIFSAGFIVFRRRGRDIQYLLLHHGKNYWNFPKGHMERGETQIKTALRETKEETGIKNLRVLYGWRRYEKYFLRASGRDRFTFKIVYFYLAQASQNTKVKISREHKGYDWFSFRDALKKLKYRESRNILASADRFLREVGLNQLSQKIYALIAKIPRGRVSTYKTIAQKLGKQRLSRFVGYVLNRNTDPRVPCHRVISTGGTLGGFNQGIEKKRHLLEKEGVVIEGNKVVSVIFRDREK